MARLSKACSQVAESLYNMLNIEIAILPGPAEDIPKACLHLLHKDCEWTNLSIQIQTHGLLKLMCGSTAWTRYVQ